MFRKTLILAALFALTGCLAQSRIQARYMEQEADCRAQAQNEVSAKFPDADTSPRIAPTAVVGTEASSPIFAAYSACMNKQGWKVSVPKPPAAKTATGAAVTVPTVAAPVVVVPATAPTGAAVVNGRDAAAAPLVGPGIQPAPAPASTPAALPPSVVAPPTAATYEPAPPSAAAPANGDD